MISLIDASYDTSSSWFVAGMGMAVTWLNAKFEDKKLGKYLYSINTNNSYNYELSNEVKSMCSTYVPFSLMPEDLERMAKESGIFYCMSCKKTFMMKNPSTECPHCGSTKIKPRAK